MSNEPIKIQIISTLNTGLSIGELNTQIKAIEKKVSKLKLRVDIDDKVLQKMNNFAKQVQRISESALNPNKIVEEMTNIDGSKIKRTFLNGYGGAFDEIKKRANETAKAQLKSIDEVSQGYDKLTKQVEKYNASQKKIGETVTVSDNNGVKKRTITSNDKGKVIGYTDTYDKAKESKLNEQQKLDQQKLEQVFKSSQENIRNSLKKTYDQGKVNEQFFKNFNKVIDSSNNIKEIDKVEQALQRVQHTSDNKSLQTKLISDSKVLLNRNPKGLDKQNLSSLISDLKNVNTSSSSATNSLKQMEAQFKGIKNASKEASASGLSLADAFKQAALKFPLWMGVSTMFFAVTASVKSLVDTLYVLDEKLVSIQKVSDNANMKKVWDDATASAYKYGQTIDQALASYEAVAKLGYNQQDASVLSDASMKLATVGEFKDAAEATDYLTAIMKQYKLEVSDTASVVDALNNLSNKSGADTVSLAQGLSKASSSAAMAKVSFHELSGMIATTQETLHITGNEAGTFYKSLFSRFLRPETQSAIQGIGVSTTDMNDKLRSATDVLSDVSKAWSGLDEVTKNALAEQLGGAWHVNKVSSLLENQAAVLKNTESSMNSYGSATKEIETFQNGLKFKTNEMTASFQELAMTIGENGVRSAIVVFLESVTFMVKGFTELTKATHGFNIYLPLLAAGIYGGVKAFTALKLAAIGVKASFGWIGLAVTAIELLTSAMFSSSKSVEASTDSLTKNAEAINGQRVSLEQLIAKYDELKPQAQGNADKQKELQGVLQQIRDIAPQLVKSTGDYGDALDLNKKKADQYIASLKEMTIEELNRASTANTIQINAVNVDVDKVNKDLSTVENSVKETADAIASYQSKHNVFGIDDAEAEFRKRIAKITSDISKETEKGNSNSVNSLQQRLNKEKTEYENYVSFMNDTSGKLAKYNDDVKKSQELQGTKDGLLQNQKTIDESTNKLKGNTTANNENAQSLGKVGEEAQKGSDAIGEVGDSASQASAKVETLSEKANSLTNTIEMAVGVSQASVDTTNEMIQVYQLLYKQKSLSESQTLALAEAEKYLTDTYPYLINNKKLDIKTMQDEATANGVLLEAIKKASDGQLTAEELKTLNVAIGAKSRVDKLKEELVATKELAKAYIDIVKEQQGLSLNELDSTIYVDAMTKADEAKRKIDSITADISIEIPKFKSSTDLLSSSWDKNTKKADKSATATNKAAKEYEQFTYVTDEFKKSLDNVNTALDKQDNMLSKYDEHSKNYRKTLEEENKLLQIKNDKINAGIKSIKDQIRTGNYKTPGVVSTDEAVKDNYVDPSGKSSKVTGTYATTINSASSKYNVNPAIVKAIATQESSLGKTSSNVMQVNGMNGKGANASINAGTKLFANLLKKTKGDVVLALAAYNMGEGILDFFKKNGGYSVKNMQSYSKIMDAKTKGKGYGDPNYVNNVLRYYEGTVKKASTNAIVSVSQSVVDYYAGFKTTTKFGEKDSLHKDGHDGIDLANGRAGDPVKALKGGKVITAAYSDSAGNWVVIKQDDGTVAKYMHMQDNSLKVKAGQTIKAGTTLGNIGSTGRSTGNHLHLQVDKNGTPIDPVSYYGLKNDAYATTSSKSNNSNPTLKKGSKDSAAVKILQKAIGEVATGIFEITTENALKKFQKSHGLTQDGIAGSATWNAINNTTKVASEKSKKAAENKQNRDNANAEIGSLQSGNDTSTKIQDNIIKWFDSLIGSWDDRIAEKNRQADEKRRQAEEAGLSSKKGRDLLNEELKLRKEAEKLENDKVKDIQNQVKINKNGKMKNLGKMNGNTEGVINNQITGFKTDASDAKSKKQQTASDSIDAWITQYDDEIAKLQKQADDIRASREKLDPNSQAYLDSLNEENALLDKVEIKEKNKVKYIQKEVEARYKSGDITKAAHDAFMKSINNDFKDAITNTKNAISDLGNEKVDFEFHIQDKSIKDVTDKIDFLQYKMSLLSNDASTSTKLTLFDDMNNQLTNLLIQQDEAIKQTIEFRTEAGIDGKDTKVFDERIKSLVSGRRDTVKQAFDNLQSITDTIMSKESEILSKTLDDSQKVIGEFSKSLSKLQTQMDVLGASQLDQKFSLVSQQLTVNKDKTNSLIDEFNTLSKTKVYSEADRDNLTQQLQQIRDELDSTNLQTVDYIKTLEQVNFDKLTYGANKANTEIDRLSARLQTNLDLLNGGLLSGQTLDFNFNAPTQGDTLDLTQYIKNPLADVQDVEIKIQDIKTSSYGQQIKDAEKFYKDSLTNEEKFEKDLAESINKSNLEIGMSTAKTQAQIQQDEVNRLEKHLSDLKSIMSKGLQEYGAEYASQFEKIISITESKVAESKKKLNSLQSKDNSKSEKVNAPYAVRKFLNNGTVYADYDSKGNWIGGGLAKDLPKFAKGTDGHVGGLAVVGEEGQELIALPDGQLKLTGNNGAELHDLPKGSGVLPNKETEEFLKKMGVKGYATGITNEYIKKVEDIPVSEGFAHQIFHDNGLDWQTEIPKYEYGQAPWIVGSDKHGTTLKSYDGESNNGKIYFASQYEKDLYLNYLSEQLGKNDSQNSSQTKGSQNTSDSKINDILLTNNRAYTQSIEGITQASRAYQDTFNSQTSQAEGLQKQGKYDEAQSAISQRDFESNKKMREFNLQLEQKRYEIARKTKKELEDYLANTVLTEEAQKQVNDEIQNQQQLLTSSLTTQKDIIKADFDYRQSLKDADLQKIQSSQNDIQHALNLTSDGNVNDKIKLTDELLVQQQKYGETLRKQREEMSSYLDTQVKLYSSTNGEQGISIGSYEWNLVNDKVKEYNTLLQDAHEKQVQLSKDLLQQQFTKQLSQVEKQIFNGQTEEQARKALEAKTKQQDKYLTGLEKELEIQKVRDFVRQNSLQLTQQESNLLNQQGNLEKEKLDRLQKQLDIRQLEQKLANLQFEKNIQQLTKNKDGTWDFTYTVDQAAIDDTNQQLMDKRLELIKFDEDVSRQHEQDDLDARSAYYSDLKNITDRALNGEIADFSQFSSELSQLNSSFLSGLDIANQSTWQNIFNSMSTNIDGMKTKFQTYVDDLKRVAQEAEQAVLQAQAKKEAEKANQPNNDGISSGGKYYSKDELSSMSSGEVINLLNSGGSISVGGKSLSITEYIKKVNSGEIQGFASGGYTGEFGNQGKLAMLHEKELVLNKVDTSKILEAVNISRQLSNIPKLPNFSNFISKTKEVAQQIFQIDKMEFPNVTDGQGVIDTFKSLPDMVKFRVTNN